MTKKITKNYQKQPKSTENNGKRSKTTKSDQKLLKMTKNNGKHQRTK